MKFQCVVVRFRLWLRARYMLSLLVTFDFYRQERKGVAKRGVGQVQSPGSRCFCAGSGRFLEGVAGGKSGQDNVRGLDFKIVSNK